ncbi:MAG: hypothetical protein U1F56_01510 [Rubrivivax sp.]
MVLGPAQATLIVKITASGTITSGDDNSGELTGAPGSIAGQTVEVVQTLTAGPLATVDLVNDPSLSFFDLVSLSVTVGASGPRLFVPAAGDGASSHFIDSASTLLDSQMTMLLGTDTLTSIVHVVSGLITQASPLQSYSFVGGFASSGSFVSADRFDENGDALWQFLVADTGLRSILVEVTNDVPEPPALLLVPLALVLVRVGRGQRQGVGGRG